MMDDKYHHHSIISCRVILVAKKRSKELLLKSIIQYLKSKGALRIALFGSYARGDETAHSDIDILVDFSDQKSLLDIIGMEQELFDRFGIKVELFSEKAISPYIIDRVRKEMVVVYQ